MTPFDDLDSDTMWILWAALQAMVNDCHSPQDHMTETQWTLAERLLLMLDNKINETF